MQCLKSRHPWHFQTSIFTTFGLADVKIISFNDSAWSINKNCYASKETIAFNINLHKSHLWIFTFLVVKTKFSSSLFAVSVQFISLVSIPEGSIRGSDRRRKARSTQPFRIYQSFTSCKELLRNTRHLSLGQASSAWSVGQRFRGEIKRGHGTTNVGRDSKTVPLRFSILNTAFLFGNMLLLMIVGIFRFEGRTRLKTVIYE